jgi:hypothetical protein
MGSGAGTFIKFQTPTQELAEFQTELVILNPLDPITFLLIFYHDAVRSAPSLYRSNTQIAHPREPIIPQIWYRMWIRTEHFGFEFEEYPYGSV